MKKTPFNFDENAKYIATTMIFFARNVRRV